MTRSWEESREKSYAVKPLASDSDAVSRVRLSVVVWFFFHLGYFFAPSRSSERFRYSRRPLISFPRVGAAAAASLVVVVPGMSGAGSVSQRRSALLFAQSQVH